MREAFFILLYGELIVWMVSNKKIPEMLSQSQRTYHYSYTQVLRIYGELLPNKLTLGVEFNS